MKNTSRKKEDKRNLEWEMTVALKAAGIEFVPQYQIPAEDIELGMGFVNKKRGFKYDFYIPAADLLIECQGHMWAEVGQKGGHNTFKGASRDDDKNNYAVLRGYVVLKSNNAGKVSVDSEAIPVSLMVKKIIAKKLQNGNNVV